MNGFVLHLLRHGAPERPGLLMGRTDGAPTAEGIAACMAQAGDLDIDHIVTSDLRRCRAAADAIAAERDLAPAIDPRWRELDFGDWDGLAPSALDAERLRRFRDDPDSVPPPAGERWSALVSRISAAMDDLAHQPTLVVTHGGAIRAVLHRLCGFDQRQLWAFDLPYAVLISLRVWPGPEPGAIIAGLRP